MSDIDEATGVPERARVESWLRTRIGFEDARVVTIVMLTEGLSNVTCRVKLTDEPVAAAVLRIQPTRGIFERSKPLLGACRRFGCADEPLLNRALTALLASTPSGGRLALCHGDPNPFNYLFRGAAVGRGR